MYDDHEQVGKTASTKKLNSTIKLSSLEQRILISRTTDGIKVDSAHHGLPLINSLL